MPNAAAQLVVDLLCRRGVFFFSRGIREDVLGNLFSSKDLLWEQVEAKKQRKVNHEIVVESKRKRLRKKAYFWMVRFFGGVLLSSTGSFPLSSMALGVFFLWRSRERRREVMEVYASGFAEHQGGYFISCETALGVMTGWRTLMGIPNGRVSPRM
jgi:hypothetical protein